MPYKRYRWFGAKWDKQVVGATVRGRVSPWFDATIKEEAFNWEVEAMLVAHYRVENFDFRFTNNTTLEGGRGWGRLPRRYTKNEDLSIR